ncbi:MAG: hypothetical protein ACYTJ0_07395 [Planctomycetota bacterium]|jgi:hypothetical protein
MRASHTAILHMHAPITPFDWASIELSLCGQAGVADVLCEPGDNVVVVHFDEVRTSLAQLVRQVEDGGLRVAGVAQRPRTPLPVVTARGTGLPQPT